MGMNDRDKPARVIVFRPKDPDAQFVIHEDGEISDDVEVLASVPIRGRSGFARVMYAPFYGEDAPARALEKAREVAEELAAPAHARTVASLQREDDGRLMATPEYLAFLRGQIEDPAAWSVTPGAALQLLDEVERLLERVGRLRTGLERVERWFGEFPDSGRFWDDGEPMSYSAAFGSNGERDYMRSVAREALVRPVGEGRRER